jgi:hypothetical protein
MQIDHTTRFALLLYSVGIEPEKYADEDYECVTYGYGDVDEFGIFDYMLPFVPGTWKGKMI